MKLIIQKTKRVMKLRFLNWLISLLSFIGVLILLVFTGRNSVDLTSRFLLVLFAICFFLSFIYEYFASGKTSRALADLTKTITDVENDMAVSLKDQDDSYYIMAISNVLNQSLSNLKEKNLKLESEIERNKRLSENISEFYRQMKTLRETDFKFDFFEYEINNEIFIFITGLVTFAGSGNDITEITTEDLFRNFNFSLSKQEFRDLIKKSIEEDIPLNFECSVISKENNVHWLKFWGRVCEDKTRVTGAITDITKEILQRNQEKERAIHDNITGFYNRNALSDIAGKALSENKPGEMVVFVYIGLRGYQEFQERYGMIAGNTYIRVCAEVFKMFIDAAHIPFRWWGSDFLLIIKGVKDLDLFKAESKSIMSKVEKYIGEVDGVAVTFPIAMGYAASGIHGDTPSELLEYASFAEHEALRGIAENPNPFNRDKFDEARRASLRRTFIKDIIDRNQLSIVFQPIVSLKTGEIYGFEALSRPINPIYRNILELIDDAEASGHYAVLEKRMVYNALDSYMLRNDKYKDQYLFINTAPYATLDEKDYNDIRDRYFGHMRVVFEVVERTRMDPEEINLRKSIVTKAGAKFALDDFGSGYSNHIALLALEPDIIKLDKELVRGINNDLRKQHMLEDVISYARYRGTKVLAEGVETKDELETLCRMGIDFAQGYYLGRPLPQIAGADEKAREVIMTMSKSSEIYLKNIFILLAESYSMIDEELAENAYMSTYLIIKIAERLGIEREKFKAVVLTAMIHHIGMLFPECCDRESQKDKKISGHSIFAYLLMKEYFPYPEYSKAVLYHHYNFSDKSKVFNNIAIPDEAYLICLADTLADVFHKETGSYDIKAVFEQDSYHPAHVSVINDLLDEGLAGRIQSGEYRNELLSFLGTLRIGKAETESIVRTLVYAVMFRSPHTYSHARIMEVTVGILARLTKQNWKLIEKVRMAALAFNLSRLNSHHPEIESSDSIEDENKIIRNSVSRIAEIIKKAGLADIEDLLNAVNGNEEITSDNHDLMVKDIIIGSRMLNIADMLTSLMEDRTRRSGMSCMDAIDELKKSVQSQNGYGPMLDMMDEYIEDVEGRINTAKAEIKKRYQSVINNYNKIKNRISCNC